MRSWKRFLDIARSARLVLEFLTGSNEASFLEDVKTQSAVLHQLLVMGEAVKRLSMDYRDRHSEVPWSLIAGMRDQLIHAYDVVDLDEVWKTATQDVPDLLAWLESRLPEQA